MKAMSMRKMLDEWIYRRIKKGADKYGGGIEGIEIHQKKFAFSIMATLIFVAFLPTVFQQ